MSAVAERLNWVPPAVVGAAAAASAEMAVGLLLYVKGGFLGTLTLLLCVEAVALGCGLWLAPRDTAPPWRGVRRAWLLLVFSLFAGAVVAASWEALGGLSGTWLSRGLGLACLAALPMYAAGVVLGAPALCEDDAPGKPGTAAAVGAAVGFALVGAGRSALRVAALAYVSAVVLVAAGALLHATLLEARERRWREWAALGAAHGDSEAQPPLRDRRGTLDASPPPADRPR